MDLKRAVVEGCALRLETMSLDQLCAFLEGSAHELQHVGGSPRVTALVAVALQGGGEQVRERVEVTRQQLVRTVRVGAFAYSPALHRDPRHVEAWAAECLPAAQARQ